MARDDRIGVLFVCLGNICRSPLAEGIFLHHAARRGIADLFDVDSCGTSAWHVGERPDPRSIQVAQSYGVSLPGRARQFKPRRDPARFQWIMAMDQSNASTMIDSGAPPERVLLVRSFDPATPDGPDVPDPYYGGDGGFEAVFEMLTESCRGLLDHLEAR